MNLLQNSLAIEVSQTHFLNTDPWLPPQKISDVRGKYLAISGNTGVGKSSLLRILGSHIFSICQNTIAIDEKAIHHPFLTSLFSSPGEFGFYVELNFMLQRVMLVKKWLDSGYNVIMERSLYDDKIFTIFLHRKGYISDSEFDTYMSLWMRLVTNAPQPDCLILMDYPVEYSIKNILNDEKSGIRPKEFSSKEMMFEWVRGWGSEYSKLFQELLSNRDISCYRCTQQQNSHELAKSIIAYMKELAVFG